MRDANQINDLLFTIEGVEHKVNGVYLTESNKLYVKLQRPDKSFVNCYLADFEPFANRHGLQIDIVPRSSASRDLINELLLKTLKSDDSRISYEHDQSTVIND